MLSSVFASCSKKILSKDYIPLRYNGHLNLDIVVEKKFLANFLFDTGWTGTALDSSFCEQIGHGHITTDIREGGIGNSNKAIKLVTDSIHYNFNNTDYDYQDNFARMYDFKNLLGKEIDGIFGIATFSQRPYMIDYVSQKIIFVDSLNGFEAIKAYFERGRIYLEMTVIFNNGEKSQGKFLLDTGSNQSILNNHMFMTDGIYNDYNKKKFYSKGGIGGDSNGYFLSVREVNLEQFRLKNVIMTISTDTLGMLANRNYMGIIGNDLLDDFNIIFDHKKEKIWVKPNKNFNKNAKMLFRGISFIETGSQFLIAGIVEDTDAFRKGIRMNDEIVQINNIPVEKIDLDTFTNNLKANDVLRLKIRRGEEESEIEFKLNVFLKS